ncbi:hypothetical protein [Pseudomonas aeruginosa]|uniref:hypothetical protein n=1 Tax=Pseudomonas aeruginosa TaxID=287 RepID=UPI00188C36E0|nr:hypothetical protein [Pseudomonas aeruginosa]MBF2896277.1 hypothetical protein [Pseudomonas aeruginosa]
MNTMPSTLSADALEQEIFALHCIGEAHAYWRYTPMAFGFDSADSAPNSLFRIWIEDGRLLAEIDTYDLLRPEQQHPERWNADEWAKHFIPLKSDAPPSRLAFQELARTCRLLRSGRPVVVGGATLHLRPGRQEP